MLRSIAPVVVFMLRLPGFVVIAKSPEIEGSAFVGSIVNLFSPFG